MNQIVSKKKVVLTSGGHVVHILKKSCFEYLHIFPITHPYVWSEATPYMGRSDSTKGAERLKEGGGDAPWFSGVRGATPPSLRGSVRKAKWILSLRISLEKNIQGSTGV